MVSAGKVFTNEKGRIISLIFDIFLRLVYTSEKKSTFFTWFCRSVVLQLRRGDFVEDKGEIYIDECPMLMHLSRKTTNELIQKLCEFQILKLCYKGGKCFVALANC